MPAFQAINVEPEENVDDEVDTTRQLHIDEALKRFQTALKLHSQGPSFFEEATDAYDDLFKSDIFQYPEAATEYERSELRPGALAIEASLAAGVDVLAEDVDNADSTLPQALYLAHKNHGQFLLDRLRHKSHTSTEDRDRFFQSEDAVKSANNALVDFNAALDRDPSDAELWRRAARVGAYLKSARVSRYCLEAAIELDDDPALEDVGPPSLAEGLAGEELKEHLKVLSDGIALSHPIMRPWKIRAMPDLIKRHLDPIPFLPNSWQDLASSRNKVDNVGEVKAVVRCQAASWPDIGMALVQFVSETGFCGRPVMLELPGTETDDDDVMETAEAIERQLRETTKVKTDVVEVDKSAQIRQTPGDSARKSRSESIISTRKRSQSVAGLPDAAEDENAGEKRSKRIRRRETAGEEIIDPSTLVANRLAQYQDADQHLFQMTIELLEKLGGVRAVAMDRLRENLESCASEDRPSKLTPQATQDLRSTITSFQADAAKIFINKKEPDTLGMSAFLEHAKGGAKEVSVLPAFKETAGTRAFAKGVNEGWTTIQEVAWSWVRTIAPYYLETKWSDVMKTAVVQVISRFDQDILEAARFEAVQAQAAGNALTAIEETVEMLFELHLDVYERITNPNSAVDYSIRIEAKGRLGRWLSFAAELLRDRPDLSDNLSARFLWASVFSTTLTANASRDYILQCWTSLRDYLTAEHCGRVCLQNNAVLPEISPAAADREISKLTTMDFFLGLFQDEISDPVTVIDNLEPVLNPESVRVAHQGEGEGEGAPALQDTIPIEDRASQGLQDLWKFVKGTSTELRLFLWSRLSDAYGTIKYTTKQFSCQLRAVEMIVSDFQGEQYSKTSGDTRPALLLRMMKSLDELLVHALSLALNDQGAYDIVDGDHLESTISALTQLTCMLHVAAMTEDEIRIGMRPSPSGHGTLQSFLNKMREVQVRAWCLLYTAIKASVSQKLELFQEHDKMLADWLAAAHGVLGLRKMCKSSNKIYLKMMRAELFKFKNLEHWEGYVEQVLYDLHGLKLGVGSSDVEDHGCPPEKLERRNTIQLADRITAMARRVPMKDLLKSDLKTTIEHMQGAIGPVRSTPQMVHNLRNYTELFKKPIHPLRLYQALRGGVELDTVSVNAPETALARHGWFSLLGSIALSKYKLVDLSKRQTPGAMDDLRIGATFLRHQLQFTPNRWEVWFRLAECFDYEVEDAVVWSADKMNKDRGELVKYQRNGIHCYTLALSESNGAEVESEDGDPLHDLLHGFGMRLYASSREPFAMEAFQHADHERWLIETAGMGTSRRVLHNQMQDYKVWKFAAALFRRAMRRKPQDWRNPFMISKCLWKMYQTSDEALALVDQKSKPSVAGLIGALEHAVEVVSALPKSRNADPILEPHYKILSVVHKLVSRGDLAPPAGAEILARQPHGMEMAEDQPVNDTSDWEGYVVTSLRELRDKDKSNWYHRMIVRHARLLFDEQAQASGDIVQAKAAFNVLRESMFTKTMVMNVWKCDAEQPGRHHVFTEQYVRFMVKILAVMNDRVSLEALLRRIRKRGGEFYHFNELWQTCCAAYLGLLRQSHEVQESSEDAFKTTSLDEFEIVADRLSDWAADGSLDVSALLCMKEAIELKRLNGGLMKAGSIDDLISDCYTMIYLQVGPSLPGLPPSEVLEERAKASKAPPEGGAGELKPLGNLGNILNTSNEQESGANDEGGDKQAEAPPKRRSGVRRPDILRKAEQAYIRNLEAPKAGSGTKQRAEVVSGRKRGSGSRTPNNADEASPQGDDMADHGEGAVSGDEEAGRPSAPASPTSSSPRGSIHDSADDESDLSDVPEGWDEEPPPSLVFPDFRRAVGSGHPRSSSSVGEEGEDSGAESAEDEDNEDTEDAEGEGVEGDERSEEEMVDAEDEAGEGGDEDMGDEEPPDAEDVEDKYESQVHDREVGDEANESHMEEEGGVSNAEEAADETADESAGPSQDAPESVRADDAW